MAKNKWMDSISLPVSDKFIKVEKIKLEQTTRTFEDVKSEFSKIQSAPVSEQTATAESKSVNVTPTEDPVGISKIVELNSEGTPTAETRVVNLEDNPTPEADLKVIDLPQSLSTSEVKGNITIKPISSEIEIKPDPYSVTIAVTPPEIEKLKANVQTVSVPESIQKVSFKSIVTSPIEAVTPTYTNRVPTINEGLSKQVVTCTSRDLPKWESKPTANIQIIGAAANDPSV